MIQQAVVFATPGVATERVAGLTLVKRTILALARGGMKRVVVTGVPIATDDADYANLGVTVELGAVPSGPVVVADTHHVFDPEVVRQAAVADTDVAVMARGEFTGIGAVRALASDPAAQLRAAKQVEAGEVLAHDAASAQGRAAAEAALFRSLKKRVDGPISRLVNRTVSIAITKRLVDTNVTPNQMTVVATIVGAAGVFCVLQATWLCLALGAFLVQMQSVLDGCDGEIARLKYKSSRLGEWLDNVLDDTVNIAYGVALGYAAWQLLGTKLWFWLGIGSGAAFVIHNALFYAQLAFVHRSGNPFNFRWWFEHGTADVTAMLQNPSVTSRVGAGIRALVRRDVFLFAFFVLAAAGLPQVAVAWYAAVAASQLALISTHVVMGGMRSGRPGAR